MGRSEADINRLIEYMRANYGVNLKDKHTLIEGRLQSLVQEKGCASISAYVSQVLNKESSEEILNLVNRLTTNHTFFLREKEHFDYLKGSILPELEKKIKDRDLRIWSAGCSSGEEPYTVAMVLSDYFGFRKQEWDTKILATDISAKALERAVEGIYLNESLGDIPPLWKKLYLQRIDEQFSAISDKIKDEVVFRFFNLMEPVFPFKRKFHVIFCRNVMIYFEPETKVQLIDKFYNHLEPGGYLLIGHSESIDRNRSKLQYMRPAIYRKA